MVDSVLFNTLRKTSVDGALADVAAYEPPADAPEDTEGSEQAVGAAVREGDVVRGCKGLSAQHVFIAGLHDKELPRNPGAIQDLEICKFIVGLTRTRKMCSLIYTRHFANKWMLPSTFISWIKGSRLERVKVSAEYWKVRPGGNARSE